MVSPDHRESKPKKIHHKRASKEVQIGFKSVMSVQEVSNELQLKQEDEEKQPIEEEKEVAKIVSPEDQNIIAPQQQQESVKDHDLDLVRDDFKKSV